MSVRIKNAPEFLGIGMQKAGTSWLYEQLKNHPNTWLPIRKELHFFDALSKEDWNVRRQKRALKNIPELTERLLDSDVENRDEIIQELEENIHFARTTNNLEWYQSFWQKVADQNSLLGEITPAYSILDPDTIRLIREQVGVGKIILILRNPVERSWSQYKMMTERKSNDPETVYMKNKLVDRGRAKQILVNWESVYHPDELFIGFYDDIKERPYWFLNEVCQFLNLDFKEEYFPKAENPVRVSRDEECPKHILDYFIEQYRVDLDYLANRFQGHASKWALQYS